MLEGDVRAQNGRQAKVGPARSRRRSLVRESTRETVSIVDHAPAVTWSPQTVHSAIAQAETVTLPWLHFDIVAFSAGLGCIVAGWLADPQSKVEAIFVGPAGEEINLVPDAMMILDQPVIRGLGAPEGLAANRGFVLLTPERSLNDKGVLAVRLQLGTGAAFDYSISPTGDVACLSGLVAAMPFDDSLRFIARSVQAWQLTRSQPKRPPALLDTLTKSIYERIDDQCDYATHTKPADARCQVGIAVRVGCIGMLISGWLFAHYGNGPEEISLVSLFGRRILIDKPILSDAFAHDADAGVTTHAKFKSHFTAFATVDGLDASDLHWFIEIKWRNDTVTRSRFICSVAPSPLAGIEATIALATGKDDCLADLFEQAISPAVEWFWAQTRGPRASTREQTYGDPIAAPRVSMIVPVYGRLDLVRHQLARFSNDPDFRTGVTELIYVLDDPVQAGAFERLSHRLYGTYGVAFRTLIQSRNLGYAAASNAGAAIARGSLLLLLNSDVFPIRSGWVGQLARTYGSLERCGILGCRLLSEDGSIQHAGMHFQASNAVRGWWENDHPGRGLPVSFDWHTDVTAVPAVTGACLMIERALYERLGGLSEAYVIGDFEDSDLCLRVHEQGLSVYYTPNVELYHLERQSMRLVGPDSAGWRQSLTYYNMWKHSRMWAATITKVMERFQAQPAASRGVADTESAGCSPSATPAKKAKSRPSAPRRGR